MKFISTEATLAQNENSYLLTKTSPKLRLLTVATDRLLRTYGRADLEATHNNITTAATLETVHKAMSAILSRNGRRLKLHSNNGVLLLMNLRSFSSTQSDLPDLVVENLSVHRIQNIENGSTEYILLPPEKYPSDISVDSSIKYASVHRHRNILFAARSFHAQYSLEDICLPLVEVALKEAGENGEQPQAIASLSGLCDWVGSAIQGIVHSKELTRLQENDKASFEAVQAIATGVPRSGHSVLGVGTYRDGEEGWKALAREFCVQKSLSHECNLYEKRDARLVDIEHMADRSPSYLQSAGGAMARLFFL